MMKNLNFLIKPSSALCNMRCKYCFYADEAACREEGNRGFMSAETCEQLIRQACALTEDGGSISFTFQGGEPTLCGVQFYEDFAALAQTCNDKGLRIQYSIQTNGLKLDEDWLALFKRHRFLVGVSLDGLKELHDLYRVDAAGKATWNKITKNIAQLKRHQIDFNILCVVTRQAARSPLKLYNNLKKLGLQYLQFIPCLDPLELERGGNSYSLTPELYTDFLCRLFDAWYEDWAKGQYVSIRLFDDYVQLMMGLPAGTCSTCGSCGGYYVIEGDGSIYPCDFFCVDEWLLGKLNDEGLEASIRSETETRFIEQRRNRPLECTDCVWQRICQGGCPRDWVVTETGTHNYFCETFKAVLNHARERLLYMARCELGRRRGY